MQQFPGYPQPATAAKPTSNHLLLLALASLLCWCVAPVALVLGLLARGEARKQGTPMPSQARLALILGSVGSGLLVLALVVDAVAPLLVAKPVKPSASIAGSASAVSLPAIAPGPSTADTSAGLVRDAAVVEAAHAVAKDHAKLEATMASADAALASHQLGKARRTVDGLSGTFVGLDPTYLVPGEKADAATRDALNTAGRLLSRYEKLRKAVEANEMACFDAAFNVLWDPKNAQKDEDQLYAGVGKRFGLTGSEVQAIFRRNEAEADRRLKARSEAESRAINPKLR
ncbi:MAG TPA: hypothetical protein VNG33_17340 [Polyangiaceae bacterium]|nr:hypothetical protein [Polyangiaceae bacterium]